MTASMYVTPIPFGVVLGKIYRNNFTSLSAVQLVQDLCALLTRVTNRQNTANPDDYLLLDIGVSSTLHTIRQALIASLMHKPSPWTDPDAAKVRLMNKVLGEYTISPATQTNREAIVALLARLGDLDL